MTNTSQPLPLLSRYAHLSPDDGSCLMEYVSVLAGQRFTDTPKGTHPLLAAVAQRVNDATSDHARPRLAQLAPDLIGLNPPDPGVNGAIVHAAVTAALVVQPRSSALYRDARRAARQQRHGRQANRWAPLIAMLYRRGFTTGALDRAVRALVTAPDADTRLHQLLANCITIARSAAVSATPHAVDPATPWMADRSPSATVPSPDAHPEARTPDTSPIV